MSGFPIWMFHKEKCAEGKIFKSKDELDLAENQNAGWVDSPTKFDVEDNDDSENEMSKSQLIEAVVLRGLKEEKDAKKLNKSQLIELLK